MKYRSTNGDEIEAFQIKRGWGTNDWPQWAKSSFNPYYVEGQETTYQYPYVLLLDLHGQLKCRVGLYLINVLYGDWIVKTRSGIDVIKPDTFARHYKSISNEMTQKLLAENTALNECLKQIDEDTITINKHQLLLDETIKLSIQCQLMKDSLEDIANFNKPILGAICERDLIRLRAKSCLNQIKVFKDPIVDIYSTRQCMEHLDD
jgi:hypothetical protein